MLDYISNLFSLNISIIPFISDSNRWVIQRFIDDHNKIKLLY